MHPLKIAQWRLFWKKVGKSRLQHIDGAQTSHCPLSVLLRFLWPLAWPSQSCATWLASIRMSITLTGSFVRMHLDSKVGRFFFFLAWPQTWPFSLRKRFSTSASHSWYSQPDSQLALGIWLSLSWLPQEIICLAKSLSLGHGGWHDFTQEEFYKNST